MARDLYDRRYRGQSPVDARQPYRFGRLNLTVEDSIVAFLRKCFRGTDQPEGRTGETSSEMPEFSKFLRWSTDEDADDRSIDSTVVPFITRTNPGVFERLPHIVVSATIEHTPFSIGPRYVATVQEAPRIDVPIAEPYDISAGSVLAFRLGAMRREQMWPGASSSREFVEFTNSITFVSTDITVPGAMTASELATAVNERGIGVRAESINIGTANAPVWSVRFLATSPQSGLRAALEIAPNTSDEVLDALLVGRRGLIATWTVDGSGVVTMTGTVPASFLTSDVDRYVSTSLLEDPDTNDSRFLITDVNVGANSIEFTNEMSATIADPTTTNALWFIGLRDDARNTARPPMHRFCRMGIATVRIEVACEQSNTRAMLASFVETCFDWLAERDLYAIVGRSNDLTGGETTAEPGVPNEHYQITQKGSVRGGSGRNELPRPGDGTNKVFLDAVDVTFDVSEYIDRSAVNANGAINTPDATIEAVSVQTEVASDEVPSDETASNE